MNILQDKIRLRFAVGVLRAAIRLITRIDIDFKAKREARKVLTELADALEDLSR